MTSSQLDLLDPIGLSFRNHLCFPPPFAQSLHGVSSDARGSETSSLETKAMTCTKEIETLASSKQFQTVCVLPRKHDTLQASTSYIKLSGLLCVPRHVSTLLNQPVGVIRGPASDPPVAPGWVLMVKVLGLPAAAATSPLKRLSAPPARCQSCRARNFPTFPYTFGVSWGLSLGAHLWIHDVTWIHSGPRWHSGCPTW